MQKMEKYYGFKVKVSDKLDPISFDLIKTNIKSGLESSGLDPNDFHAYFHQMIIHSNDSHFNFPGGLDKRVSKINLEFRVNKKQRENGKIKFYNFIYKPHEAEEIIPYYSIDTVGYIIPSVYFNTSGYFQNSLVVFIHKSLRRTDFKKIKACVSATPAPEFEPYIVDKMNVKSVTELDIKFNKEIQLHLPFEEQYEDLKMKDNQVVYNINIQNAGAVGQNAKAENFTNQNLVVDSSVLVSELIKILKDSQYDKEFPDKDEICLTEAIDAANRGDQSSLKSSLSKVSMWTVDKAEKIGVTVAAAVIKSYIGV